jgi:hypothetical protein
VFFVFFVVEYHHPLLVSEQAQLAGELFPFFPVENPDCAELAVVSWINENLTGAHSAYGLPQEN